MFLAANSITVENSCPSTVAETIKSSKQEDYCNVDELEEILSKVKNMIIAANKDDEYESIRDILLKTIRTSPVFRFSAPDDTGKLTETKLSKKKQLKPLTNTQIVHQKKITTLCHSFFSLTLDLLSKKHFLFTQKETEKLSLQALNLFPEDPLIWEIISSIPPTCFNSLLASRFSLNQAHTLWPSNKRIKRKLDILDSSIGLLEPVSDCEIQLKTALVQENKAQAFLINSSSNTKEDVSFKISDRSQSVEELLIGILEAICGGSTLASSTTTIPQKTKRTSLDPKGWFSTYRISYKRDDCPPPIPLSVSRTPSLNTLLSSQPRRQTSRNTKKSSSPPPPPPPTMTTTTTTLPETSLSETESSSSQPQQQQQSIDISLSLHYTICSEKPLLRTPMLNKESSKKFDCSSTKITDSGLLVDLFVELFYYCSVEGFDKLPISIIEALNALLKEASKDFQLFVEHDFSLRKAILECSLNAPVDLEQSRKILSSFCAETEKHTSPLLLSTFFITKEPYLLSLSSISFVCAYYCFTGNVLVTQETFSFLEKYSKERMEFLSANIVESKLSSVLEMILQNESDPSFFKTILTYPKTASLIYSAWKYAMKMDNKEMMHEIVDLFTFSSFKSCYLPSDFALLRGLLYKGTGATTKSSIDLPMLAKIIAILPPQMDETDQFILSFFSTITYQEVKADLDSYNKILLSSILLLKNGSLKFSLLRLAIPVPMTILGIQDLKDPSLVKDLIPTSLTHSSTSSTFWNVFKEKNDCSLLVDFLDLLQEFYDFSSEKGISLLDWLLKWFDISFSTGCGDIDQCITCITRILLTRPSMLVSSPILLPTNLSDNAIRRRLVEERVAQHRALAVSSANTEKIKQNIKVIIEDCKYLLCLERQRSKKNQLLSTIAFFIDHYLKLYLWNSNSADLELPEAKKDLKDFLVILFNCTKIANCTYAYAKTLDVLTSFNSALCTFFPFITRKEAVLEGLRLLENCSIDSCCSCGFCYFVNGIELSEKKISQKQRILKCIMYKDIIPIKPVLKEMLCVLKDAGYKEIEEEEGIAGSDWKDMFVAEIIHNRRVAPLVYDEFMNYVTGCSSVIIGDGDCDGVIDSTTNVTTFSQETVMNNSQTQPVLMKPQRQSSFWSLLYTAMDSEALSDDDEEQFLTNWAKLVPIASKGKTANVFLNIQHSTKEYIYPGQHFMMASLCLKESCRSFLKRSLNVKEFKRKGIEYILCILGRLLNNNNAKMTVLSRSALLGDIWEMFFILIGERESSQKANEGEEEEHEDSIRDRVKKIKRQLKAEGVNL